MFTQQTIFIIDDDVAVRDSLAQIGWSMGYPVRKFSSASEFLEHWSPELAGCIVLDIRMPGISGLELQKSLCERGSHLPVIIVTGHGDVPLSVSAMKAGAVNFLEKPFSPEELVASINDALAIEIARREEKQTREEVGTRFEQLTEDERQVLIGVADGKTNSTIAEEMDVSLRTIQFRRANIKKKLRVDSKSEMISLVRRARKANVKVTRSESGQMN